MTDTPIVAQIQRQARAMASYALGRGMHIPEQVLNVVRTEPDGSDAGFVALTQAHTKLADAVAPAMPTTIDALAGHDPSRGSVGPLPLLRQMMLVVAGTIVAVLGLGALHSALGFGTGYDEQLGDVVSLTHFLVSGALFVSLAALGSSFHALMTLQRQLDDRTLDLHRISGVWARFALGVVSGVLLATYLDVGSVSAASQGEAGSALGLGRPLLALLGGFGADVVYRLLDTAVKTAASAFDRNSADLLQIERSKAQLRLQQSTDEQQRQVNQDLLALQKLLASGASQSELQSKLDGMLGTAESSEPSSAPAT